jgi:TonB family protein
MTFQRSLYISLFIHVLVFGSAIAFAQFGRGALRGHREVTVVSLLGPGSGTQGRASQSRAHREVFPGRRSEAMHEAASSAAQPETLAERQAAREEGPSPDVRNNDHAGIHDAGDAGALHGQTGEGPARSGPDTQFGLVPAEQWAVIVSSLERVKTYPRLARERGIQGVAHVRFKLRTTGDVETVEIVKSSGYDILDTASIRTVYRAAPMPYVSGWVEVPMAYILK